MLSISFISPRELGIFIEGVGRKEEFMSYAIIRSIKIKDSKVYIHSTDNNVFPYHWHEWECSSLSNILKKQGKEALDLEILEAYEEGNFQRGSNKYTRALEVLRHFPEYKDFDWRGDNKERRNTPAYKELLKRALNTYLPKDKYIIQKPNGNNGDMVYLYKVTKHYAKWTLEKERAKIFRYENDAKNFKKWFTNSESWSVNKIN